MNDTETRTAAAVLRAAADQFEAHPELWGQQMLRDPKTGCMCALGGIAHVVDPADSDHDPEVTALGKDAVHLLAAYLSDELGFIVPPPFDRPWHLVGEWNDRRGRTVHEVIGTLRSAATWWEVRS